MEKKSPKILVLRIFNHSEDYDQMYDLHIKNDESLFVIFDDKISENVSCVFDADKRIIKVRGNENLIPGIIEKTIKSIEFCLCEFLDWDILIRSNISTVVNTSLIIKYFQDNHPDGNYKNIYGGQVWTHITPFPFVSGTSIILSRDLCELMISNKYLVNMNCIDDVSIGLFFHSQRVIPNIYLSLIHPEEINWNEYNLSGKDYFVRFKRCAKGRNIDIDEMKIHYDNLLKYK